MPDLFHAQSLSDSTILEIDGFQSLRTKCDITTIWFFGLGLKSQAEVARDLNLSRERVRQIELVALRKVRTGAESGKLKDYLYS